MSDIDTGKGQFMYEHAPAQASQDPPLPAAASDGSSHVCLLPASPIILDILSTLLPGKDPR